MANSTESKAACSVCQEYCQNLMSTGWGFTQACPETDVDLLCFYNGTERPKKRSPRQTTEMNEVSLEKGLSAPAFKGSGGVTVCETHQEPLKVFCMEDHTLICLVCDKSKKHRTHTVLPVEEAVVDYKKEIQIRLRHLMTGRNAVQELKLTLQKQTAKYMEEINMKREKIVCEFHLLRRFLAEQESFLLCQLDELKKEMEMSQKKNDTKLSDRFSYFSDRISDLEEDCQKPATEFLQNVNKTLSRCGPEISWEAVNSPRDLELKLQAIVQKSIALKKNLKKFKDTLAAELKRERAPCLKTVPWEPTADSHQVVRPVVYRVVPKTATKVQVTLDPSTASPKLILSLDRKAVRNGDQLQTLPDNPERFDAEPFVLGCVGFCSGKRSWVVNVEKGQNWAVGVARESVKRKGYLTLSPEQGIWAVEQCWGQFRALASRWTALSLSRKPRRIRVVLDYESGWVAFFDADLDAPIFTFPPVSFRQEKIYPWLWVGPGSSLSL